MATDDAQGARDRNTRTQRVTKEVVERRVRAIGNWLIQGHRPRRIYTLVSEATNLEREKRQKAKEASAAPPLFVWGDESPPCSTRMIDVYIRKARDEFERTGRELTKKGAEVLGMTWEQINDLYWRALADKRYVVCERLIRTRADLFGLVGAIKFRPLDEDTGAPAAGMSDAELPETTMTLEQMNAEWLALASAALTRSRESRGLKTLNGPPVATIAGPGGDDTR